MMTKIVPLEIDSLQLFPIDTSAGLRTRGVEPVGKEQQRFPGRLEAGLELAGG